MPTARKALGVLCLITALVTLGTYYFNAADPEAAIPIWQVVDVIVVIAIFLTVVLNAWDSLRIRRDPEVHLRQLPRDVITVVAAFVLMLFLHNHLLSALPHPPKISRCGSSWTRPPSPSSPGKASACSAPSPGWNKTQSSKSQNNVTPYLIRGP